MGYVETPNGTVWENPPPAPTYKTEGITRTEWIGLFTPAEVTLHTRTRALIENMSADFSYLSGGALMDDAATALGRPDATYRDLLRDVFFHFDSATYPPGISVSSPNVIGAMAVQVALGLITQESSNTKLLGVPL
jgi:hypothetical protein